MKLTVIDNLEFDFFKIFKGHIENEVDLHPTGSCTGWCEFFKKGRSHDCFWDLVKK